MKPASSSRLLLLLGFGILLAALSLAIACFFLPKVFLPVSSSDRKLPIYAVERTDPVVALTFDAAWGNEDTGRILSILSKYNIKATFFLTGSWISSFPEDVKALAAAGHDVGNHSENHLHMSTLSLEECKKELQTVSQRLTALTGKECILFRPPYGDYNNTLLSAVEACGAYGIQWNVDSLDWKNYGTSSIIDTVLHHKDLSNGSIILMHNGGKYTAAALESVITGLTEKGYSFLPVSQLIYRDAYHMDHTGRQIPDPKE